MNIFQTIILGIVQGLTEFLPISSSGHLTIMQHFFGMQNPDEILLFNVLLHLGTLISVVLVFWRDVVQLVREFFSFLWDLARFRPQINKNPYRRMLIMLIIATVPLVLAAVLQKQIEYLFDSTLLVGVALIINGFMMFVYGRVRTGTYDAGNARYSSALWVGLIQFIAVTPGISRSGSTIVAGQAAGLKREFAVKFSFLLSIIAILGASALSVPKALKSPEVLAGGTLAAYGAGMICAVLAGIFAIRFLLRLINNGRFHVFAYYCWVVGVLVTVGSLV